MNIYHVHHITPKHMGGNNDISNLIKLTIPEHAAWHYELWVYCGKQEDYVAWKALSGCIKNPEIWYLKSSLAHKYRTYTKGQMHHMYGKKRPDQSKRMSGNKLTLGWKPTEQQTQNKANKIARNWKIIDPIGKEYFIHNLKQFCENSCLNYSGMSNVANGRIKHYKQWKCIKLT